MCLLADIYLFLPNFISMSSPWISRFMSYVMSWFTGFTETKRTRLEGEHDQHGICPYRDG